MLQDQQSFYQTTVGATDNEKIHLQIGRSYIEYRCSKLSLTSYQQDRSDWTLFEITGVKSGLLLNIGFFFK